MMLEWFRLDLVGGPKTGFSVPLADWLRGPLRSWADELMRPAALPGDGLIDADKVGRMWRNHLSGRFDHSNHLWNILMYQSWARQQNPIETTQAS